MIPRQHNVARLAGLIAIVLALATMLTGPSCGGGSPESAVTDGTEVDETTWEDTGFNFRNRVGVKDQQSHDLGLRFDVPNLVQGQTVAYARIILPATGDGTVNGSLPLEVVGLDVDDVAPFTTTRPSQNPLTVASTPWTVASNWPGFTEGQFYSCVPLRRYSPDVSAIVNEILARPGWGGGAEKTLGMVVRDANPPGPQADNFVTVQDATGFGGCSNDHSARLEIFPTVRDAFVGTELLGRLTDSSVTVNAASLLPVDVYFEYSTNPANWTDATPPISYVPPNATDPVVIEVALSGLASNTRYYYRMRYRHTGDPTYEEGPVAALPHATPAGEQLHLRRASRIPTSRTGSRTTTRTASSSTARR